MVRRRASSFGLTTRGARRAGVVLAGAVVTALACSDGEDDRPPGMAGGPPPVSTALDPCHFPQEGCACPAEGATTDCGTVESRDGDDVVCLDGERVCTDGRWGACEGRQRTLIYAPLAKNGQAALAQAGTPASCGNVCAPECRTYADTPTGLTPGTGLTAGPDGLTLAPTGGSGGGSCETVVISPSNPTITVTSFSPLVTSPANIAFTAKCGASGPSISPTWTISSDDLELAAINRTTGVFAVYAGVAKDITVTARTVLGSATTTARVRVNVNAGGSCSSGAITTQLNNAAAAGDGGNADPAKLLYPYSVSARPVVFPLSIAAPLVQYATGGRNASCVKVTLRYPSSSPIFEWQKIVNGEPKQGTITTDQPAFTIDQTAWDYFGRTAQGDTAQIVMQRRTDSTANAANPANKVMGEKLTPVKFATDALRGTVYYTQYLSQFRDAANTGANVCTTQSDINIGTYPSTNPATGSLSSAGPMCPVGNCTHPNVSSTTPTSQTRAVDLSRPSAPNRDPFNAKAGCPVCHSVSADGSTYVSGSDEWQLSLNPVGPFNRTGGGATPFTSKGISDIGSTAAGDPLFTGSGDAPFYTWRKENAYPELVNENSRGFSYAAITPDGSRVLQAANFWGNTAIVPSSNNVQDATVRGITNKVKPYFLVKTQQRSFGVQFATTSSLPGHSTSSSQLSGNSGSLTVDGVVMQVDYTVLVKDQPGANARYNGIYIVTQANPWRLVRRDDANGTNEIQPGSEVRVNDGNTNYGDVFYVSSPGSGSITPGTTNLTFTQRTMPALPNMMVPVFSPDGTKVAYVNADADTISGQSTGWRRGLTMFSFDQSKLDTGNAATAVTGKKRLLNFYNSGNMPVKWPFFEPDSRSLLYVETDPSEWCDTNNLDLADDNGRACSEAAYGSMSPTTRARWPGKIYSLDTASGNPQNTRRELSYINRNNSIANTMDPADYNQAYQPTVLPFVSGGYRWVIFTSQRAYGNQFNASGTHFTCSSAMLWMAAIDDTTATSGTARDYPAFLMPGQKIRAIDNEKTNTTPDANGEIGGQHYVNERGYLVPSPCKPAGTGSASACTVSQECCGGTGSSPTAACRIDLPVTSPVTRHCTAITGECSQANESCSADLDCCGNSPGNIVNPCINGQCEAPPSYSPATFVRDYDVTCPSVGYKVVWGDFRWRAKAESTSSIVFTVQTSSTASFASAPVVALATANSTNINAPPAAARTANVGAALSAAKVASGRYLRVSMTFTPSGGGGAVAPILYDWEQRYECVPAE